MYCSCWGNYCNFWNAEESDTAWKSENVWQIFCNKFRLSSAQNMESFTYTYSAESTASWTLEKKQRMCWLSHFSPAAGFGLQNSIRSWNETESIFCGGSNLVSLRADVLYFEFLDLPHYSKQCFTNAVIWTNESNMLVTVPTPVSVTLWSASSVKRRDQ